LEKLRVHKRVLKRFVILTAVAAMLVTTFCSANLMSSIYLSDYVASCTPIAGGKIVVSVEVDALSYMSKIGASTIYIYKSSDAESWNVVKTYKYTDYPQMMSSGLHYNAAPITFYGTPGYYYCAGVVCYAGNSSGSDQRLYTTSGVRAIT
jgi:hypothetical protein